MENPKQIPEEVKDGIKEIEELSIQDIKAVSEGIPVKVKKILKGKLEDLIEMVRDPNQMRDKGLEWIRTQGNEPYLLIVTEEEGGVERKFLVHETYASNGTLYKLLKKYGVLKPGMEILIRYDPESMRFKIATD